MTKKHILKIAIVLLTLSGFGVAFSILSLPGKLPEIKLSDQMPPPQPQALTDRRIANVLLKRVQVLGNTPETFLNYVDFIKIGPRKTVYVFDRGVNQVIQFDLNTGQIVQRYGKGLGKGPGEFNVVTDFEVDNDGYVYVCDSENSRITIFSPNGSLLSTLSLSSPPLGIALLKDKYIAVQLIDPKNDALFEIYQLEKNRDKYKLKLIKRFGKFFEKQAALGLLLNGLITGSDTFFVYAPRRIGWLTAFRLDGTLLYHRTTIDPIPVPKLIRQGAVTRVDRNAPRATFEVVIDGNKVYLYAGKVKMESNSIYMIDLYDAYTGDYLFSIPLPERFGLLAIRDSLIYATQDTVVTVWHWQLKED
ncbi:6-bladed beta-propeller [Rhodothermus profundi]|nr:6-bladed beta-propeller [Rhodothermus profundi]